MTNGLDWGQQPQLGAPLALDELFPEEGVWYLEAADGPAMAMVNGEPAIVLFRSKALAKGYLEWAGKPTNFLPARRWLPGESLGSETKAALFAWPTSPGQFTCIRIEVWLERVDRQSH